VSVAKIAIVTGGAGFIGSHACDQLLELGYRVRVIDNLVGGQESNLAQHSNEERLILDTRDILKIDSVDSVYTDADLILHFAGIGDIVPSIERPMDYMGTNVQGTVNVLEGARLGGARKVVYAASSSCYGSNPSLPTSEKSLISTEYPYALSKYLGELTARHWSEVYGLPVNAIRIFNAYGPRSRTSGAYGAVFGVFLKQKLADQPFTVVGDGTQERDFVFVSDVARAFVMAAETPLTGKVWNVGGGKPQSINYLVKLLQGPVTHLPKRPGEPNVTWADITAIKSQLGWQPRVSFEDGVAEILANIEYWENAPLWTQESISVATETWFEFLGDRANNE
jgi:UDP-glucose 4-epimerase